MILNVGVSRKVGHSPTKAQDSHQNQELNVGVDNDRPCSSVASHPNSVLYSRRIQDRSCIAFSFPVSVGLLQSEIAPQPFFTRHDFDIFEGCMVLALSPRPHVEFVLCLLMARFCQQDHRPCDSVFSVSLLWRCACLMTCGFYT